MRLVETVVLKKARVRPEWEVLETVWGIGKILGLIIMYEAGEMSRFASAGRFASYCRCVDARRISNGKTGSVATRRRGGVSRVARGAPDSSRLK